MSNRAKTYVLGALLLLLAYVAYTFIFSKDTGTGLQGVLASDAKFQPINVDEPHLRVDLLEKLKNQEYSGSHRNIFAFGPPPPPPLTPAQIAQRDHKTYGPQVPAP